jgi:hypothetical protein
MMHSRVSSHSTYVFSENGLNTKDFTRIIKTKVTIPGPDSRISGRV